MIVPILTAMVLALLWAAVIALKLTPWIGITATGLAVLFLGVRALIRRRRARRAAAAKLEEDITAQAEEQARTVRPDLQPEIQAMKSEFSRAMSALKTSKLARGGRDALAVLPWYLMIGPPGTGKSTALRNSGLKFPYLSNRGAGGVRGVGGTRNCDWWLTNDAVFLDTAGRYTTGEEDRNEWFAFLDILCRYRPHRPINGLVITVSVNDLMTEDPQAAGELGQRIRERVDEVTARLKVVVPIYVMITKSDLLTGFMEMFADLPRSERGQIWGFTVPLESQEEAPSEFLLKRFDELTSVLEQRAVRRLGQERRLEARERIHQFPHRFDALRRNLAEFVQPLFLENVFQDTPVMRGVYFTSGTQDTRPAERPAQGGAAEVFGSSRGAAESTEGRSFFLWEVFNKVMFQDQKLAVRSSMEEIRLRKQRYTLAAACLASAALVLVLPAISYVKNLEMLRTVRDSITTVKLEINDDISRVQELSPLQQQLAMLHQHRAGSPPFWMRMGMYQGDKLYPLAQSFYNNQLKGILLGRQHGRIRQALEQFAENQDRPEWKPSSDSYGRHFNDLKLYLLITWPRSTREPALDEEHQSWIVRQMVSHWTDVKGKDWEISLEQAVTRHAETYIAMLAADPQAMGFKRDERIVRYARRALNRVPLATLQLEQLVSETEGEFPALSLGDMVGAVPEMKAGRKVRGAYTRRAWEDKIRLRLDSAFQDTQRWVLNRDSRQDEEALRAELRTRYYQQYIQEWSDFLLSIQVEAPGDIDQTERLLTSLTRGKPAPYGRLFQTLAHNAQLQAPDEPAETTLKDWISKPLEAIEAKKVEGKDKKPPPPPLAALIDPTTSLGDREVTARDVARHFSPLVRLAAARGSCSEDEEECMSQLDFYQERLKLVLTTILEVRDKPGESGLLIEKIKSTRNDVERLIASQEGGQAVLSKLLLPPLRDVRDIIFRDVAEKKSLLWCEEVAQPFMNLMASRYPFNKSSLMDVPLAELAEYIRPSNGAVRRFLKTQLTEDVVPNGRRLQFGTPGSHAMYKDELLLHAERVNTLATALFPSDEMDPLVRFQIRIRAGTSPDSSPSDIASIKFIMDGTEVPYRNGPDNIWHRMIWPGQAGELGATIEVVDSQGNESKLHGKGEWGLFRLLERVKSIEPSPDGRFFTATWEVKELRGALVSIDIRPERLANPFFGTSGNNTARLMQLFRDPHLLPPLGIARNGKNCPQAVSTGTEP
ncbi:MAG TPA: type VI secretion system membrane subunit TssM [Archangium sp.]|uniref:type VI secretion system membrane subunit TssM n=1 Tax=Archangium sp. TaxID=1872627 RepID=UPI002E33A00B|nr:type VI secretion system membrane subunit TssM [Archangium sp.]HEX5750983.1 type VI secretion system membrane subunit TssM [Archangium sp.]